MLELDQTICGNLAAAATREWLLTNGLGGYASATVTGMNTRRYHGLLVAALRPPVKRTVLLSKLEETLIVNGERYDLAVNRYAGAVHPQGQQYLKSFRLAPLPVFTYEVAGVVLEKRLALVQGENTVVVQYHLKGKPCELELTPLLAFRDYHSLTHENSALQSAYDVEANLVSVAPYPDLPRLYFAHNAADVSASGFWYRQFEYEAEAARGLDAHEDLFNPFQLKLALSAKRAASLIISTQPYQIRKALGLMRQAVTVAQPAEVAPLNQTSTKASGRKSPAAQFGKTSPKTKGLTARATQSRQVAPPLPHKRSNLKVEWLSDSSLIETLKQAANQFLVTRGEHKTIIAGYHWFSDWGRDTMIALPGLTLVTGRYDVARDILLEFTKHLSQGMLPNRFPDQGETPEYNTVDATLWFIEAVRAYLHYTNDTAFIEQHLYPALKDIIAWHVKGTRFQIQVQADGLLHAGEAGIQLTWMDAKIGDWVVTPRVGKPVEIQALWFNALCVMEQLAARFGEAEFAAEYQARAALARNSFSQQFWNAEAGCLFDVVDGARRDGSIRPNQIFAVSLPHSPLTDEQARQVVAVVERALLTPYGLRSLSPRDANYRGRYAGGIVSRDGAYHQGTVWAWLMGPFITAYVKTHGRSAACRAQARQWLQAFVGHFAEAGLNQVSEVFDGDAPHTPGGCIAQAWSVAELLRAALEDAH